MLQLWQNNDQNGQYTRYLLTHRGRCEHFTRKEIIWLLSTRDTWGRKRILVRHMSKPCRATKTLSYTRTPTILIVHLKRLILGKKIQNHIPLDTALDLEPYMTPGHASIQDMKLIGIISHQGTKDNGHYTAMTNREDKWTLHNDAITTQTTTKHIQEKHRHTYWYIEKRNKVLEWGSQYL